MGASHFKGHPEGGRVSEPIKHRNAHIYIQIYIYILALAPSIKMAGRLFVQLPCGSPRSCGSSPMCEQECGQGVAQTSRSSKQKRYVDPPPLCSIGSINKLTDPLTDCPAE